MKETAKQEAIRLQQAFGTPELKKFRLNGLFWDYVLIYNEKAYCSKCGEYLGTKDEVMGMKVQNGIFNSYTLPKHKYCPHCHAHLRALQQHYKRKSAIDVYVGTYAVAQKVKDWLVIRAFWCQRGIRPGYEATPIEICQESWQIWIKGENIYRFSLPLKGMFWRAYNPFRLENWNGTVNTLKICSKPWSNSTTYFLNSVNKLYVATKDKRYASLLRKLSKLETFEPAIIFYNCSRDPFYETLIKMDKANLAKKIPINEMQKYKNSLRIALKNNAPINDWTLFKDTIRLMEEFHVDINSPKYLTDLIHTHNRLLQKKEKGTLSDKIAMELAKIYDGLPAEEWYEKNRGRFFDLDFKAKEFHIRPILSVKEMVIEGHCMHHCVGSLDYWKKKDCLILVARDYKDNRIATIEINSQTGYIIQVQGPCNKTPMFNEKIYELLRKNMRKILKISKKFYKTTA